MTNNLLILIYQNDLFMTLFLNYYLFLNLLNLYLHNNIFYTYFLLFRLIDRSFNSSFQNIFESGFKLNKENNQKRPSEDSIVTNSQWDTCVSLEETQTDITTHSEFGKFDFQVIFKKHLLVYIQRTVCYLVKSTYPVIYLEIRGFNQIFISTFDPIGDNV